jgi:hypothetical protein
VFWNEKYFEKQSSITLPNRHKSAMPKYFSYVKKINLTRNVTNDIYIYIYRGKLIIRNQNLEFKLKKQSINSNEIYNLNGTTLMIRHVHGLSCPMNGGRDR